LPHFVNRSSENWLRNPISAVWWKLQRRRGISSHSVNQFGN
jgi:hypothetical protein